MTEEQLLFKQETMSEVDFNEFLLNAVECGLINLETALIFKGEQRMNKEHKKKKKEVLTPIEYEHYVKHLFDIGEITKELYIELSSDL